ncbi:hypothetical protein K4L44_06785 [Halosquirtibacter laminarini]|uniref:Uncharacterized protein n=1 Tax=Halosquirtibacter laminarini TaxID=3374600 RepID=A0AC61NIL4_9BACT|nr:hypothetical protein K4L44_06785 [Prolixibacteraceae bacterium]
MEQCKLCNKKEADKKGSHMIPAFLINEAVNVSGQKGRDYELQFEISNIKDSEFYFGRGVQPKDIEEVVGEITDDIIENNNNSNVIDNIFCSECEKRLGELESLYASKRPTLEFEGVYKGVNSLKARVFWLSVVWRMHLTGKYLNNFTEDVAERFRSEIYNSLYSKQSESVIDNLSYILLYPSNLDRNKTAMLVACIEFTPAMIYDIYVIAGYILIISVNGKFDDKDIEYKLPFDFEIESVIINNLDHEYEVIKSISSSNYTDYIKQCFQRLVKEKIEAMKMNGNIILDILGIPRGLERDNFLDDTIAKLVITERSALLKEHEVFAQNLSKAILDDYQYSIYAKKKIQ